MEERTLKALKKSIKHWQDIVKNRDESSGPAACALCAEFYYVPSGKCKGCPVYQVTGQKYCQGTPYTDFFDNRTRENARAEVRFLKSLLPESK